MIKSLISNFFKLKTRLKKNVNIKKGVINKYEIIDKYKKEYTTHTPFSDCLNLKSNYLNILDIGCFGKNIPEQFSSQKNINFYGVDIDTNNINFLKKKYTNNKNYFFFNNKIVEPKNLNKFLKIYKYNFKNKYKNIYFEKSAFQKYDEMDREKKKIKKDFTNSPSKPDEITIDQLILKNNIKNINFLKIDIDSNDSDVLYGSEHILKKNDLFGIKIEVKFSEPNCRKNFYEPFLYLSDHNFVLHKIITNSYASDKIPEKFFYNFNGQNFNGTDLYGDLIFFKTLDNNFIKTLDKYKLLNFCKILEIHNLDGMAAEILLNSKEKFGCEEIKNYLNKLCEKNSLEIFGKILDYKTFISRIDDNPKVLLNDIW